MIEGIVHGALFPSAYTSGPLAPQSPDKLIAQPMHDMTQDEIEINIGCGVSGLEGWHNLDNSLTISLSSIPLVNRLLNVPSWPKDVRRYDVRKGLPFKTATARYIYSSHTFEHFTYPEALKIAKECFRV